MVGGRSVDQNHRIPEKIQSPVPKQSALVFVLSQCSVMPRFRRIEFSRLDVTMNTTRSLVLVLLPSALLFSCSKPDSAPATIPDPVTLVTSGYAEINSVKLYYEVTGEGEPLLLLHGGLGGSDHFSKIISSLTESFKVITVDRRGHGRSYDNGGPYTYAAMADETAAFLDHLQLESVNVLGFSDGGVVGYHLASTYPDKVRKLVAVGANFRVNGLTQETIEFTKNRLTPEGLRETFPRSSASTWRRTPNRRTSSPFSRDRTSSGCAIHTSPMRR